MDRRKPEPKVDRYAYWNPKPRTEAKRTTPLRNVWGVTQTPEQNVRLHDIADSIHEARFHLQRANRTMEALATRGGIPKGRELEVRRAINNALRVLTHHTPYSVCPACKSLSRFQRVCTYCDGQGYATNRTKKECPAECKEVGVVLYQGKLLQLAGELEE